jgi:hypothetical protein
MKAYGHSRRDMQTCKYGCCTTKSGKKKHCRGLVDRANRKSARQSSKKDIVGEVDEAPPGTTHVLPANLLEYDPMPDFYKRGIDFIGPESGEAIYCWYWWDRNKWVKDRSFCDRHKRLLTLTDWQGANTH